MTERGILPEKEYEYVEDSNDFLIDEEIKEEDIPEEAYLEFWVIEDDKREKE